MRRVSIAGAKPKQVLAQAVTTAQGATLCPSGFRLTETAIERLKRAGIESVVIKGSRVKGPTAEVRIAALNRRFDGIDDPIMLQIKATIENRLGFLRVEQETQATRHAD